MHGQPFVEMTCFSPPSRSMHFQVEFCAVYSVGMYTDIDRLTRKLKESGKTEAELHKSGAVLQGMTLDCEWSIPEHR
jgi:hypothetical protein